MGEKEWNRTKPTKTKPKNNKTKKKNQNKEKKKTNYKIKPKTTQHNIRTILYKNTTANFIQIFLFMVHKCTCNSFTHTLRGVPFCKCHRFVTWRSYDCCHRNLTGCRVLVGGRVSDKIAFPR